MYTAAVLTEVSANLLRYMVMFHVKLHEQGFHFRTESSELPHHMTINLGPFDDALNDIEINGCPVIISIDTIVYNKKIGVCAATVCDSVAKWDRTKINSANKNPHITCCVKNGCKPRFSNVMLEEQNDPKNIVFKLDKIYKLEAVVKVIE